MKLNAVKSRANHTRSAAGGVALPPPSFAANSFAYAASFAIPHDMLTSVTASVDANPNGTPAAAAETRVVEAPQQVKRPPPVKNHKSWKGRLPAAELYGADAPASVLDQNQNEKFEKLDEYLRGTSDAAARKAEARAAALARSRAAQLKLAREEGCESSDL